MLPPPPILSLATALDMTEGLDCTAERIETNGNAKVNGTLNKLLKQKYSYIHSVNSRDHPWCPWKERIFCYRGGEDPLVNCDDGFSLALA